MSNDDLSYNERRLAEWMRKIGSGNLALPKFQRSYVWSNTKTKNLLEALLRGRPIGTLLLIPDDPKRFASRAIKGVAQEVRSTEGVELVLDGQRRLTSLWGAFTKSPELFVKVRNWDDDPLQLKEVWTQTDAGVRGRKRAPSPILLYEKECFPFDILGIDGVTQHDDAGWQWCNEAMENAGEEARKLWRKINRDFGEPLRNRGLWHLTLPTSMSREDAINVYVETNQSSAVIKKFDIAVALYDADTEGSLRDEIVDMVGEVAQGTELIRRFFGTDNNETSSDSLIPELGELLLKVACLWADLPPSDGNYTKEKVLDTLRDKTKGFRDALVWSLDFYVQEGIVGRRFVPSYVPLRVLPALHPVFKKIPQRYVAKATRILRAYLWRAFLTERYSRSANTRLHQDYRGLRKTLENLRSLAEIDDSSIPIFKEDQYRLPELTELTNSDKPLERPQQKKARSRAVFAISLRLACDFGTGQQFTRSSGTDWDYHHLFPQKYLEENGVREPKYIDHCLNFALITDKTNNAIGKLPPHRYLASDSDLAQLAHGEPGHELKVVVETHRIPFEVLSSQPKKNQAGIPDVVGAYQSFIEARGQIMWDAIRRLTKGDLP